MALRRRGDAWDWVVEPRKTGAQFGAVTCRMDFRQGRDWRELVNVDGERIWHKSRVVEPVFPHAELHLRAALLLGFAPNERHQPLTRILSR